LGAGDHSMPVIRFYANLRTLIKQPAITVDSTRFPTLRAVLNELIRLYPEMEFELLDRDDNLRQDLPIYLNGRNPRLQSTGLDSMLAEEDIISMFSPIASGRMNVEVLREE
jgi:molybdopterin converting factor small subunit